MGYYREDHNGKQPSLIHTGCVLFQDNLAICRRLYIAHCDQSRFLRVGSRGLGRLETDLKEASEAELKTKQHVRHLILSFDHKNDNGGVEGELEESVQVIKRIEGVLEILRLHPNLVSLGIALYLGSKFPSWISINNSTLARLRTLGLYKCSNLTKFPALGKLPSLIYLEIEAANEVTHIGREFYGIGGNIVSATNDGCVINLTSFPKLEAFIMVEMQNLEEWDLDVVEQDGNHKVEIMPCVTWIKLNYKKLKMFIFPT